MEYSYIFIFLLFLIDLSNNYQILTLDDPTLCHGNGSKGQIKLGLGAQSGLILRIKKLKDRKKDFFCQFQVKALASDKIFVVLQKLTFARSPTGECVDYIHFKRFDGSTSRKYCGNVHTVTDTNRDVSKLAPNINAFDDYTGQLDVNVYISEDALVNMKDEIVFTAYRPCSHHLPNDQVCGRDSEKEDCIYKGFINDGIINCPYLDCVDEGGCSMKTLDEANSSSYADIVIICIVLAAFIIFACFIWFYNKNTCWSNRFTNTRSSRSRRSGPNIVINQNRSPGPGRASAISPAFSPDSDDKDLPPSYESLFHDR